jgi:hypothetical protein
MGINSAFKWLRKIEEAKGTILKLPSAIRGVNYVEP